MLAFLRASCSRQLGGFGGSAAFAPRPRFFLKRRLMRPLLQLEERPPLAAANLERRAAAEDAVEERHGRDADVVGKRGQAARGGDAGAIRHPPTRREEELRISDELCFCDAAVKGLLREAG